MERKQEIMEAVSERLLAENVSTKDFNDLLKNYTILAQMEAKDQEFELKKRQIDREFELKEKELKVKEREFESEINLKKQQIAKESELKEKEHQLRKDQIAKESEFKEKDHQERRHESNVKHLEFESELEFKKKTEKLGFAKIAEQGASDLVVGVAKVAANAVCMAGVTFLGMWLQAQFGTIIPKDISTVAIPGMRKLW